GDGVQATDDFFNATRLKAALAKALVTFYPLAGRIDDDGDGRAEVNCGNQGVLFVVARSEDLTIADFHGRPSSKLRRLFVPRMEPPSIVCGVQLTFFKCGGVAIGLAVPLATIASSPCSPPAVHPDALSVFCPMVKLCEPSGVPLRSEAFLVSKDQPEALKQACGGRAVSTFCALTAHIWKCVSTTRPMPPDATTRLTFLVSIRRKLAPPLPTGYFGNAVIRVGVTSEVRGIVSEELTSVASRIKGTIRRVDDELVRSAIDYFELAERDSRPAQGSLPMTELRVVSWLGMPIYDTDFGWGRPVMMMRAESERGGRVYMMDGDGDGDGGSVRIIMCLEATIIKEFHDMLYAKFSDLIRSSL
ncbi:putrescine hydroxycinnamoyltransferase 1-like, partial [Triticum dicoccoides]|uniref:putrescine hydroxycinnamoyltransferase 1-like n=2 Tax=Triticum dicoccoides TaxID=85692 RepID=UPI00188E850A